MKTEPEVFSIQDLRNAPNQITHWDGVRNYQARNYMRDQMQLGDKVLVYHSNANPSSIVGIAQVVKTGYPDRSAWDPKDSHFDPKSSPENPRWYMVDIQFEAEFSQPLPLADLRELPALKGMVLLQKGSRLSVQPVHKNEFELIRKLGKPKNE